MAVCVCLVNQSGRAERRHARVVVVRSELSPCQFRWAPPNLSEWRCCAFNYHTAAAAAKWLCILAGPTNRAAHRILFCPNTLCAGRLTTFVCAERLYLSLLQRETTLFFFPQWNRVALFDLFHQFKLDFDTFSCMQPMALLRQHPWIDQFFFHSFFVCCRTSHSKASLPRAAAVCVKL
jgi:hypothetical protein